MGRRFDLPARSVLDPAPTLWDSLTPPPLVPTTEPRPGSIEEAFQAFRAANPWVEEALRRLALDLVRRGRKKVGMKGLFEVLRWQHNRATADPTSDFKLNNNYTSRFARLLMEQEPELAGAFEIRELTAA